MSYPTFEDHVFVLAQRLFETFMVETLKSGPIKKIMEQGDGPRADNLLANVAKASINASTAFCTAVEEAEGVRPPWVGEGSS